MATTPRKTKSSPAWLKDLASHFAGGAVKALGPVLKDFNDRITAVEVDPTDLAHLETQVSEEITKGLKQYLDK